MAKLSSLKIKMGQMQYEKQRKELKLQAAKVGSSQDDCRACRMIMVSGLSLLVPVLFLFLKIIPSGVLFFLSYPHKQNYPKFYKL